MIQNECVTKILRFELLDNEIKIGKNGSWMSNLISV
jgi:hypothetical protein